MPAYRILPSDRRCTVPKCPGRIFRKGSIGVWACSRCDAKYRNDESSVLIRKKQNHGARSAARSPLTVFDRVQAVIRCPDYIQEAEKYRASIKRGAVDEGNPLIENPIDRRWGVPAGTIFEVDAPTAPELFADGYARRFMVKDVRECRYLLLEIDLALPAHESLRIAASEIVHYQRCMGVVTEKRNKPTKADPWQVYDLHRRTKPNLSLLQITRRLFRVKGNPATDQKVAQFYRLVERAYHKASEMIATVQSRTT